MTNEDNTKEQVLDEEVSEFLTSVESIKTEVGEFKSWTEQSETKQAELEEKIDSFQKEIGERIDGFLTKFNDVIDGFKEKQKEADLKKIPKRETELGGAPVAFTKEEALEAGLRSIIHASLDPDVKEIVLMPDLKVHVPSPDPESWGYNMGIYREVIAQ